MHIKCFEACRHASCIAVPCLALADAADLVAGLEFRAHLSFNVRRRQTQFEKHSISAGNAAYHCIYRLHYIAVIEAFAEFCIHLHCIFTLMMVDSSARCFLIRVISPFIKIDCAKTMM